MTILTCVPPLLARVRRSCWPTAGDHFEIVRNSVEYLAECFIIEQNNTTELAIDTPWGES